MHTLLISFRTILSFWAYSQQRYIYSGIIAHCGRAYERGLPNKNYAPESVNSFSREEALQRMKIVVDYNATLSSLKCERGVKALIKVAPSLQYQSMVPASILTTTNR